MKKNMWVFGLILLILIIGSGCGDDDDNNNEDYPVLINGQIVPATGFGMGVDDAGQLRNWVSNTTDSLRIQYPGGLDWGAIFITVSAEPVDPPRPYQDFSQYTRVTIEMKGASGGECVQVGMKDAYDSDDGNETKRSEQLTTNWETYEFNLSDFTTCQLSQVYVVTEFVFPCPGQNQAQTIDVRTISFLK